MLDPGRLQLSQRLVNLALERFAEAESSPTHGPELAYSFSAYPRYQGVVGGPSKGISLPSHLLREAWGHRGLYCLDPYLSIHLAQIAPAWKPIDLPRLHLRSPRGILAFDDSWTAVGWSDWWTRVPAVSSDAQIIIIHLDDHQDLVHPLLLATDTASLWSDILTDAKVSLSNPATVAAAVVSGAIGIGCFFVPFVHLWTNLTILHLQRRASSWEECWLYRSFLPENRLAPGSRRPAIERSLRPAEGSKQAHYIRSWNFRALLAAIPPEAHVLLHIDLDYFNDELAGGVTRIDREPCKEEMLLEVASVFSQLEESRMHWRIEHTSVALSPGFCPSKHWHLLLGRIRSELIRLNCPCPF